MNPENTLCLIIDIQERLLPALHDKDDMLHHSRILIQGLHALGVPFAVTEQYPKGLGKTVPAVSLLLPETTPFIEKTRFARNARDFDAGSRSKHHLNRCRNPYLYVANRIGFALGRFQCLRPL